MTSSTVLMAQRVGGRRVASARPACAPRSLPMSSSGKLSSVATESRRAGREAGSPRGVSMVTRAAAAEGRPTILVAEKLGQAGLDMLSEIGNVDCSYGLTPEELQAKISLCDALIIRSATKVTREVFEASKGRLKVVGRAGVGVDNVDLAAATEHGCMVVNAPTANTVAAAEHGIALLCAVSRNVAQADASMKTGGWERSKYVGVSLVGKTLAIMGFGKVGSEVARRAKGLGMNVVAHDPYASEEKARAIGVKLVAFEDALKSGDFFSLHMPLTPGTKNMFNMDAFKLMKKGARIINVARGGVIDESALAQALDEGLVAQAALDVFSAEPPAADNPLVGHPNVVCTPHLGASTREAQEGVAMEVAEAVADALQGKMAATAVNAPMVPVDVLAELQPYVTLSSGLGRAAVQLVKESGFSDINIVYSSPRGDDLDTRLLRSMVIKGILEQITEANVNLVNADLLAKNRGFRISEVTMRSEGEELLTNMSVSLGTGDSKFSAAVDKTNRIYVQGTVNNGLPYLTQIGSFDVELAIEGLVILVRQQDQPGIIANVATSLATEDINISFMTVGRTGKGEQAIMAVGVDTVPSDTLLQQITGLDGIIECTTFTEA